MRLLQIITSLSVGGAETMLANVLESLDRREYEVLVVSLTTRSPIGDRLAAHGIPVVALEGRGSVLTLAQLSRLVHVARAWRPDVIHTWMYHANLTGHAVRFVSRGRRPILITSIRGALHDRINDKVSLRMVRRFDAALSGRADRVVFNSAESARQHIEYGYTARKVEVIPNGFDVHRFAPSAEGRLRGREALGIGDGLLVGLIGRYDRSKDHRMFLSGAAQVLKELPDCRFALVGRGCDSANAQLMDMISAHGLGEKVMLFGERQDIPDLDCAMDVVVSSSVSESFPNAIGEAMACGTPVLVTDVGGSRELVGECGIVVPARDSIGFAAGLIRLLRMTQAERSALGAAARRRIVETYSLPAIAQRFELLYRSTEAKR